MTVKSPKSISLRQPIDLLLPLSCSHPKNRPLVSGFLTIAGACHGSHLPQTCSLAVHGWPNIPHLIHFSMKGGASVRVFFYFASLRSRCFCCTFILRLCILKWTF
ncbi:unnamed protein product [Musa textilis]